MSILKNHPKRFELANELHARPFPELAGPGQAIFFAATIAAGATTARDQLISLLDKFGVAHPPPGSNHYYGPLGRNLLKWELHSEFVTYTLFIEGETDRPFADDLMDSFPEDWLADLTGEVVTSAQVVIERVKTADEVERRLASEIRGWFVGESLAAAYVLDRNVVLAGDFRIDEAGHMRFAVLGIGDVGARRIGRVVQRVLEIETYKTMSMMSLETARDVFAKARGLDNRLSEITQLMTDQNAAPDQTLDRLLAVSAEIEQLSSASSFRFGAGRAYRAIVSQRIKVLRENRILERQLFSEFMMRRFDPAMRTCDAAEKRLEVLSEHAARASELLGTRVSVDAADQNHQLLRRMNQRAALQMRLQETVEGLSVVAVSYYAVNLLVYLLAPLTKGLIADKTVLAGALVLPVILVVWLMIRRIKARVGATFEERNKP